MIVTAWVVTHQAAAQSPTPATRDGAPYSLNVRDFGAKGDGVSDDSDAIQRALLQAGNLDGARYIYWKWTAAPEVFFPEGTYVVSRTLLVPVCGGADGDSNHINLRGEKATIQQTDPTQDILYFRMAHRNLIEGLTFEGGKRQLKIWSRNMDQARVVIRDCTFRHSSSYAIDDQLRLDPEAEPKNWYHNVLEPYTIAINDDGLPILTAVDETQYPICLFVSTGMRISHCTFERCMKVLSVWADWALMDHCTIETHPEMEGQAILCGAAFMLEDVTGLAHITPGKRQWWVTLDPGKQLSGIASLHLKRVRLKTDSQAGLCVVRNEAKWTGGVHVSIIADQCEFQSAGSPENSAIYLVEAPNLIDIRNCKETSGTPVNILGFDRPFDEEYFRPGFHWKHLTYIVDDGNEDLVANLPEVMQPFADQPLPEGVAQRFEVQPTTVTLPRMREDIESHLNIRDFGADGQGTSDDSDAFREALEQAAGQSGLVEVIVPAGVYRLDESVELPPRVVVRGVGHALLTVPSGRAGSIFTATAPGPKHLAVQNLHFYDCEQALEIRTEPDAPSDILIDNCRFHRNRRWAVTCLSGTGAVAEPNETTLRLSDCTFSLSPVLLHNTRYAMVDNAWVTTDPSTTDGVFVNRGFLHLHTLLGVPRPTEHDMRWVDNYSRIYVDRCRFGGEGGGLPMVVNFASEGEVLLEASWLFCKGNPRRVTIVDCEQMPDLIALRDNWGWPPPNGPQMMATVRQGAEGELDGRFFESCNTVWPSIKDERKESSK